VTEVGTPVSEDSEVGVVIRGVVIVGMGLVKLKDVVRVGGVVDIGEEVVVALLDASEEVLLANESSSLAMPEEEVEARDVLLKGGLCCFGVESESEPFGLEKLPPISFLSTIMRREISWGGINNINVTSTT